MILVHKGGNMGQGPTCNSATLWMKSIKNDTNLSFNLPDTVSFQDSEISVEQKLPKMLNLVAFPVFDSALQLSNCLLALLFVDSVVGSDKH